MSPFRACSGQGKGARSWSVSYDAPGREWWRPETASGRVRLWASYAAAARYAATLDEQTVEHSLARQAASALLAMDEAQRRQVRSYRGIHAAFWGRDPMGLYTAECRA